MAGEISIRPATPDDGEVILDLVRASLGEGSIPRSREYWNWKHVANPFGESAVLLAESDGRVVGLRVFMRWSWRRGNETYRAVRAVDTATHPDWQGRGIFSKLTKALVERMRDEGAHFIYNTPNEKSRPGYLKMGWIAVGRTELRLAPGRPGRLLRTAAARAFGGDPATVSIPDAPGALSIAELCARPEFAELLQAAEEATPDRLHTPRDIGYMRWRYGEIPGFRYHALIAGGPRDGGAVVFRYKAQGPFLELRICEMIVGPTREAARIATRLLDRLRRMPPADYLSVMPSARRNGGGFASRGFLPAARIGPILTARPLNPPFDEATLASRSLWDPSIGDLEIF